jgi:hypothetical protein
MRLVGSVILPSSKIPLKYYLFFVMAGGNEAQRSDRMKLPKDSDDEVKRHVFRRSKQSLRCVHACHVLNLWLRRDGLSLNF